MSAEQKEQPTTCSPYNAPRRTAYAAATIGLFDSTLITAIITLSVVTNLLVPFTLNILMKNMPKKKHTVPGTGLVQDILTR